MSTTGRFWRRQSRVCPQWCAKDHQCTVWLGHPAGEHRSDPLAWRHRYGTLVATRIENHTGRGRLEVRAVVKLPADEEAARWVCQQLAVRIDLTIRDVLALPTIPAGTGAGVPLTLAGRARGEARS